MSKFAGLAVRADQPARMPILHPATGQPLRDAAGNPGWIDVLSMDSAAAQRQQRLITNRRLSQRARKLTAEELEAERVDMLAALVAAWHLVGLDGTHIDVPFTPANAAELFAMPESAWLREQVDAWSADRGNFLRT